MTVEETLDNSKDKPPKQDTIVYTNETGAAPEIDIDESKAKFLTNGGNDDGDETVIITKGSPTEFGGLTKEELMKYANDPFWVRTRLILFVIFWIGWLLMLVAAIVIIVLAPRCPYRPNLKWYDTDLVYEITPRSFKDSDGDGIGDLKGIQEKSSYLDSIHVKTIWLHSVYQAKFNDSGYGLLNHTVINPKFGTESSLVSMLRKYKKTGHHLILDLIPFHTHKEHAWFAQSIKKEGKMADYYIWIDNDLMKKLSTSDRKVWHKDKTRNQYYLGIKDKNLPNLNLYNDEVRKELEKILTYWFARGVDGFHINDLESMINDISINETMKVGRQQTLILLKELRTVADKFSDKPGKERLLFGTMPVTNGNETAEFYGDETKKALHFVAVTNLDSFNDSASIIDAVKIPMQELKKWKGWTLSSNKKSRPMSRINSSELLKAVFTLQMLIPGTAFGRYGDEIGMTDARIANLTDSLFKEDSSNPEIEFYKFRAPMSWDSINTGFSSGAAWFPAVSPYNVAAQRAYNNRDPYPPLSAFSDLVLLRGNYSFQWGKKIDIFQNKNILSFVRKADGYPGYLVAINFGKHKHTVHYKNHQSKMALSNVEVVFHSMPRGHKFTPGTVINLKSKPITLHGEEAIVFKII